MAINQHPAFGHSVFYAYLIKVNDKEVGSIQKLNVRESRDQERIGEIKYNSSGLDWKEILWGYTSPTLDLSHVEFYTTSFLQAIGGDKNFISLAKFNFSFDIDEIQYGHTSLGVSPTATPAAINNAASPPGDAAILRTIKYQNCVPTSYSKAIDRGTIHVAEDMTVECTRVVYVEPSAT